MQLSSPSALKRLSLPIFRSSRQRPFGKLTGVKRTQKRHKGFSGKLCLSKDWQFLIRVQWSSALCCASCPGMMFSKPPGMRPDCTGGLQILLYTHTRDACLKNKFHFFILHFSPGTSCRNLTFFDFPLPLSLLSCMAFKAILPRPARCSTTSFQLPCNSDAMIMGFFMTLQTNDWPFDFRLLKTLTTPKHSNAAQELTLRELHSGGPARLSPFKGPARLPPARPYTLTALLFQL